VSSNTSGLLSIEATNHGLAARATEYDWNQHPVRIRLATDLVRVDPEYRHLLEHLMGGTVVVDTLTEAVELHRAAPHGFRYVTAAGEVLESDGTLRAGPLTAAMGLLSRRSELDAIASQITEVDGRIELLSKNLADGNAAAHALEEEQNALRNLIYQSNTQKVELTSNIAQSDDKLSSLSREQPLL